jgi:hypothetical protein
MEKTGEQYTVAFALIVAEQTPYCMVIDHDILSDLLKLSLPLLSLKAIIRHSIFRGDQSKMIVFSVH